jgi:phosphotransferase system  glucose/maltose/N-acetylglucosamine-specific IIC component
MRLLENQSTNRWLKTVALAASVGAFLGILEIWFAEFSVARLYAAAAAGATFAVVLLVLIQIRSRMSASRGFAVAAALPAGALAGAAWWVIASPSTSLWVAVLVGVSFGAIAVFREWPIRREEPRTVPSDQPRSE